MVENRRGGMNAMTCKSRITEPLVGNGDRISVGFAFFEKSFLKSFLEKVNFKKSLILKKWFYSLSRRVSYKQKRAENFKRVWSQDYSLRFPQSLSCRRT